MKKIQTVLAIGLVAAFASSASAAALDVESGPLASGRYVAGAPGPINTFTVARADAIKHMNAYASAHTTPSADWVAFDRAVGGIR